MKYSCFLLLFLFFLAPSANIAAQKRSADRADSSIIRLFEPSAQLLWIRHYDVRMDDVHTARMDLGFDGVNCNGYFTYTQSKQVFLLRGELKNGNLVLQEIDQNKKHTGTIQATFIDEQITGQWIRLDRKTAKKLEARQKQDDRISATNCSENKWFNRYETTVDGGRGLLFLSKIQDGIIVGQFWQQVGPKAFHVKGNIAADGQISAILIDQANKAYSGTLKGELKQMQKVSFVWDQVSNDKRFLHCTLSENLSSNCIEFADYASAYDIVYPKTRSSGCNQMLDQVVQSWVAQTKGAIAAKSMKATPEKRQNMRATGWSEITCWEPEVLCGLLTLHSNWDTAWHGIAFNYDLTKNKELTMADVFMEKFDYKTWFKAQVLKNIPGIAEYRNDQAYAQWIDQTGFPLQFFRKDGLVLSSLFHPTFGRAEILIKWSDMKPYLRPNTALTGLAQ